jgi:quercetin dioxygenase-like cupin family protein
MRRRNKPINQNDETLSVKAGELHPGRGAAFIEYTTRQGEELPDHTHPTEDEIFYVLQGELTFRCGDESFDVGEGGFIYLPQAIEHGYTIRNEGDVRLIVVTFPTREASGKGWGGFIAVGKVVVAAVSLPRPKRRERDFAATNWGSPTNC